jgi:hypothetical protein
MTPVVVVPTTDVSKTTFPPRPTAWFCICGGICVGLVDMAYLIGIYLLTCAILNGFEVPAPEATPQTWLNRIP